MQKEYNNVNIVTNEDQAYKNILDTIKDIDIVLIEII